jgi:Tfp pilus assembly protein PilN
MSTLSTATNHAAEHVSHAARASFIELAAQTLKLVNGIRAAEARSMTSVLERIGLQRRRSSLVPVAWFAAGALVAGAAVVLMTPASGKAMRQRIRTFLGDEIETLKADAKNVVQKAEQKADKYQNAAG